MSSKLPSLPSIVLKPSFNTLTLRVHEIDLQALSLGSSRLSLSTQSFSDALSESIENKPLIIITSILLKIIDSELRDGVARLLQA